MNEYKRESLNIVELAEKIKKENLGITIYDAIEQAKEQLKLK